MYVVVLLPLAELAMLLSSCAKLGHPHKSSWLQQYVSTAQQRLAKAVQQYAVTAGAAVSNSSTTTTTSSSTTSSSSSASRSRQRRKTTASGSSSSGDDSSRAPAGLSADVVSGSQGSEGLQAFAVTVAQLLDAMAR